MGEHFARRKSDPAILCVHGVLDLVAHPLESPPREVRIACGSGAEKVGKVLDRRVLGVHDGIRSEVLRRRSRIDVHVGRVFVESSGE